MFSLRRQILTIATLTLAHVAHGQAPPASTPDLSVIVEQQVRQLFESELAVLAVVANADAAKIDTIRQAMSRAVQGETKTILDQISQGQARELAMSDQLKQALNSEVAKTLGAETAKLYEADYAGREMFKRKAAQRSLLVVLDRMLSFSQEQESKVAKAFMNSWNDDWNGFALTASQMGSRILGTSPPGLPNDQIKAAMSEEQATILDGLLNIPPAQLGAPQELAKLEADQTTHLAVSELKTLCKLTTGQAQTLEAAGKKAAAAIVAEKMTAITTLQDPQSGAKAAAWELWTRPTGVMLSNNTNWKNVLNSTLVGEQKKLVANRTQRRERIARVASVSSIVYALLGIEVGLSAKQMDEVTKVLSLEMPSEFAAASPQRQTELILELPDQKFARVLNEQQIAKLAQTRRKIQTQLEAMRQQSR